MAGILFIFAIYSQIGQIPGAKTLPVTYAVLELMRNSFTLFMLILIIYYSGELIWRERDLKFFMISDALPSPRGLSLLSKIFCMGLLQVVFLGTVLVCGVLIQSFKGYFHLSWVCI